MTIVWKIWLTAAAVLAAELATEKPPAEPARPAAMALVHTFDPAKPETKPAWVDNHDIPPGPPGAYETEQVKLLADQLAIGPQPPSPRAVEVLSQPTPKTDPPPVPPQETAPIQPPPVAPTTPVQPPANTPPTDPQPKFDLPAKALLGKLIVDVSKSTNCKLFRWELYPDADTYWDAGAQKLVLIVVKPATYTLRLTATSPDGGLTIIEKPVTFADPAESGPVVLPTEMHAMGRATLSYCDLVRQVVSQVEVQNKRGGCEALAKLFDAIYTEIEGQSIRSVEEFGRALGREKQMLAGDYAAWDAALTPLGERLKQERDLAGAKRACYEIAGAFRKAAQ